MLSSAATFSFFLAIGSVRIKSLSCALIVSRVVCIQVIRNDALLPPHLQAVQMQLLPPLVRSRAEGAMLIRARWDAEKARRTIVPS
ncbi:hypothetical protein JVU11DRAFT_5482 [Chiua virens]|nr:hypothetical protein JVU11DRAFT_5482 [Chiua virens]